MALKRLAVARLWHEGNSFSPLHTHLADFRRREWVIGDTARSFYRDTATELGAVVTFAENQSDWLVDFMRAAAAPPGGPLTEPSFAAIREEILAALADGGHDAVYLSLHGALVTERSPTPELDLIRDVRHIIGDTPLGVTFDLHANIGRPLLDLIDVAVGYKTYPHTDMASTAAKLLRLLTARAEGRIQPTGAIVELDAILPSFNMRTTDGPMAEVAALARKWMNRAGMLDVSIFGGFAYGDSPYAGASVMAFSDGDPALAADAAETVGAALAERRERFYVRLHDPASGIAAALAAAASRPVAVVDPADNPLSGGIGDTTGLFRALLAAAPTGRSVFAFFHDPVLVDEAHRRGVGTPIEVRLGGRHTDAYGAPVELAAVIRRLTDGRFRNRGPMERNLQVDLGRTAVLQIGTGAGAIDVIITESCQAPNDPGYFDLHDIDLFQTRLLCVKAKNHFRAAFAPLLDRIIEVDAPGPASLDLTRLPFRHAPARLYRGSAAR
jgi:microcystin degradation protein MlrC